MGSDPKSLEKLVTRGGAAGDVLATLMEEHTLFGHGGADTLSSLFNWTRLKGGGGRDTLTTIIDAEDQTLDGADICIRQDGDSGKDELTVKILGRDYDWLTPGPDGIASTVLQTGGRGADQITSDTTLWGRDEVHAESILKGGRGDDHLKASTEVSGGGAWQGGSVHAFNLLKGGAGDDVLEATAATDQVAGIQGDLAENRLRGGSGDDELTATAKLSARDYGYNHGINDLAGGAGDDSLAATITSFADHGTVGEHMLDGESGNDDLSATSRMFGFSYANLTQKLFGREGDDVLTVNADNDAGGGFAITHLRGNGGKDILSAVVYQRGSGYYSLDGDAEVQSTLKGGGDDDALTSSANAKGEYNGVATNILDGAGGSDSLTADSVGYAYYDYFDTEYRDDPYYSTGSGVARAKNMLDGGADEDALTASARADGSHFATALNRLDGGDGDDVLTATAGAAGLHEEAVVSVANILIGGAGADMLTATIVEGDGASALNGGGGDDVLKVSGGQDNLLKGGAGDDILEGGAGDDRFIGGADADTFVFDVARNLGTDAIADFDPTMDNLRFKGVADLAELEAAIVSVTDLGVGQDVVVAFASESLLRFKGAGLGSVDDLAGLDIDPGDILLF